MKILVAVKRVIDYNVQIRVKSDQTGVEMDNVKMSMNPPDENAVEEALKLKDSGIATEVVVVSIGQEKCQDTIRSAMAMGADRGILIKTDVSIEPLAVAKILKAIVEKEQPDMVLLGKQAIDDDSNQTGQMLSALLNWPQGCFISKLGINDKTITITREIDEGLEHLEIQLPAVVTCDLRLNEPRFASLPNIMKAKKKPLDTSTPEELGVDVTPRVTQVGVELPAERSAGIKVDDVAQLVDKLKNEAKVIS